MLVSWATPDDGLSVVQWGRNFSQSATGSSRTYQLLGLYHSPHLHTAAITGLSPSETVTYRVGNGTVFSDSFTFTMPPASAADTTQRLALIGDQGHTPNSVATTNSILASHKESPFSALLFAGDLSYADGIQPIWDKYMEQIQPLASILPFQVIVGNHEYVTALGIVLPNLRAYEYRFTMPAPQPPPTDDKLNLTVYYSMDIGNVHVIALNSENTTDFGPTTPMYQWLEKDLVAANANRKNVPFIVAMWHRPWYSSNHVHGNDTTMRDALEPLFLQHRVNLVHNGHVHAYERTHCLGAGGAVMPPNSDCVVYMTNGMAGNGEGLYDHWVSPEPEFSAHHEGTAFGHTELNVLNSTHLHLQLIANNNGSVLDDFYVTQKAL